MNGEVTALSKLKLEANAGGKALALARLIQAGFNVPAGFIVNGDPKDPNLRQDILEHFDKLKTSRVAVRSSAASEDGARDAWAGQLDSYLNVSREELIEKIALCQKLAGSERAKSYAKQKGLRAGHISVIVQKMITSATAGVAFSIHPVSGQTGQMVIEAVAGLGEKLVAGSITPDTYVIDKKSAKTIEAHTAGRPVLTDEMLTNLSQTIKKVEVFFGHPVDVEWAISDGRLYILQSRPITAIG
ncbi:MAG TPA: PEP/pyruvate-binding domain-containing protein [Candidatus Saccharimonadales bacterium]|nr:PEP/pyruvate-binding domain-containing protein [Candidatus Saccharimonadales bacterium]